MCGYQESRGWVEHPWDTPDPDAFEDSLKILSFFTDSAADAIWQFLIFVDIKPEEFRENREMKKAALARYLRQSLLQWDDIEVTEINDWYDRMKILLDNESPVKSASED